MAKSVLGAGSDFYDEHMKDCQPCSVEGKSASAKTFCIDCNAYLCTKCSSHHMALQITQNHTQVSTDKAKKASPSPAAVKDKCSQKCSVHQNKAVKYYCASHSHLGCSVCFTMEHKLCRDIEHIQTAATDIEGHADYKKFDENLKALGIGFKTGIADVKKSLQHVIDDEQQLVKVLKDFRKEVIDALDTMEKGISTQAKKIKDDETTKLDRLNKQLHKSLAYVVAMLQTVGLLLASGKHCDLYVLTKTGEKQLEFLKEELTKATVGKTYRRCEIQLNKDVFKVEFMGKLNTHEEPVSSCASMISQGKVLSGPEMAKLMKPGVRVRRGKDWRDGDNDGGPGGLGTVVEHKMRTFLRGYYRVKWDNGYERNYRMGADNAYDLEIV